MFACSGYRFINYELDKDYEEEPALNPTGSARSQPFACRKPYEMFSFLLSKYRPLPPKDHKSTLPQHKGSTAEVAYKSSR